MSVDAGESPGRYQELLAPKGGTEVLERHRKEAIFLAFYSHLGALGKALGVTPDLVRGETYISIPAYFSLQEFKTNPVNDEALRLLPKYSDKPGYGDTTDTIVDESGLRDALRLPSSDMRAARGGNATLFVVSRSLGLIDPVVRNAHQGISDAYRFSPRGDEEHFREIKDLFADVPQDLNENIIGDIKDVAAMVNHRGYTDFLDYLIDARQIIQGRVDTIFSHEAPGLDK